MKFILISILVLIAAKNVMAERLLSCNAPIGSRLQEVEIQQLGQKIYRTELNFAGSRSIPVEISTASWNKKDLRWKSRDAGIVRMHQVKKSNQTYWLFDSANAVGYCEENPTTR
ncbi:MAG: hypothetical protein H7328_07725 [Bdellovibrio sp.]|nr:hypothetical protein [Bdellovibrio sp.]